MFPGRLLFSWRQRALCQKNSSHKIVPFSLSAHTRPEFQEKGRILFLVRTVPKKVPWNLLFVWFQRTLCQKMIPRKSIYLWCSAHFANHRYPGKCCICLCQRALCPKMVPRKLSYFCCPHVFCQHTTRHLLYVWCQSALCQKIMSSKLL